MSPTATTCGSSVTHPSSHSTPSCGASVDPASQGGADAHDHDVGGQGPAVGEVLDHIHKTHNTVHHPSCTVKMGADDDASAPLDARLRVKGVKGVEGLRVADSSVMPDLTSVNPCITTL